ncbi:MAG: hypothetical protein A3F68_10500 [Acidobacteria bacterium RIFCSPLOWO2_12_FULL_54_10]|nr:MAG: hypothetical protein A3F68_10500 [Acidobacteria bacterium RIFCSPLOWO2_12_FULL_54_10]
MAIAKDKFRKVLGHFATGITVVTMRQSSGAPWGFTVNAFTSVSLEPPLILVCVENNTESNRVMVASEHFAVNFLSEDQQEISRRFASRQPDRFNDVNHSDGKYGTPLLAGCLGHLECRKTATHQEGDHVIVIGEVLEAEAIGGRPLLFYQSAYQHLGVVEKRTGH